jgi:hypothetical protein
MLYQIKLNREYIISAKNVEEAKSVVLQSLLIVKEICGCDGTKLVEESRCKYCDQLVQHRICEDSYRVKLPCDCTGHDEGEIL